MSYKLYTDKKENFECKIFLEGAALNKARARVILENNDINLIFNGKINKDGTCTVPIKKLKGLLDENSKGKMKLEVIAEDMYFLPWESDFIVNTEKKVTVEVKSQNNTSLSSKPKVLVSEIKNYTNVVDDIVTVLQEGGITLKTVVKNKQQITPILENYSKKVKYKGGVKKFIRETIKKLSKT